MSEITFLDLSVTANGNQSLIIKVVFNPTITVGTLTDYSIPTYVSENGSIASVDTNLNTVMGGTVLFEIHVNGNGSLTRNLRVEDIVLSRLDSIAFVGLSSAKNTVRLNVSWVEDL